MSSLPQLGGHTHVRMPIRNTGLFVAAGDVDVMGVEDALGSAVEEVPVRALAGRNALGHP